MMNWFNVLKDYRDPKCPEGQVWCKECMQCETLNEWKTHNYFDEALGSNPKSYRQTADDW